MKAYNIWRIFHNKFSKIFFTIYFILAAIFIIQDIIADTSFFDLSGLGIYLLSYPVIIIIDAFMDINIEAIYKPDETKITGRDQKQKVKLQLPGLITLKTRTNQGDFEWEY